MTDLEFILTNANIDSNNITDEARTFIKEVLIPYYEAVSNPVFGSTVVISHSQTNEIRNLNIAEIVSLLKSI